MKRTRHLTVLFICIYVTAAQAQFSIVGQRTIGGSSFDFLNSLQQTADGGRILGGYSWSNISGQKTQNSRGSADYWVVKQDATGAIQWDKTIGGDAGDGLTSLQQTADGGYILGGYSGSDISGEKTQNNRGASTITGW